MRECRGIGLTMAAVPVPKKPLTRNSFSSVLRLLRAFSCEADPVLTTRRVSLERLCSWGCVGAGGDAAVPWELLGHTCSTREVLVAGWQLTDGTESPKRPTKVFAGPGSCLSVTQSCCGHRARSWGPFPVTLLQHYETALPGTFPPVGALQLRHAGSRPTTAWIWTIFSQSCPKGKSFLK